VRPSHSAEPTDEPPEETRQMSAGEATAGEDADGSAESEDHRRRRRGRRGGRRRPRREEGAESVETTASAAETIEILPNSEPKAPEAEDAMPAASPGDVGIEAASLPALDVEPAPVLPIGDDDGTHGPEPAVAEQDERSAGPLPTVETETGIAFVSPVERELELEHAGSGERAAERAEPTPVGESPAPEQTVTDRPANPRKGWWQRLMQS
jgi:ribonuclease E